MEVGNLTKSNRSCQTPNKVRSVLLPRICVILSAKEIRMEVEKRHNYMWSMSYSRSYLLDCDDVWTNAQFGKVSRTESVKTPQK